MKKLIGLALLALLGGCSRQPEDGTFDSSPSSNVGEIRHISGAGGIKIQAVTIDGVEYLIATTYRGVGICRK